MASINETFKDPHVFMIEAGNMGISINVECRQENGIQTKIITASADDIFAISEQMMRKAKESEKDCFQEKVLRLEKDAIDVLQSGAFRSQDHLTGLLMDLFRELKQP